MILLIIIKRRKTIESQTSKITQAGGFLVRPLGPLLKLRIPLMNKCTDAIGKKCTDSIRINSSSRSS